MATTGPNDVSVGREDLPGGVSGRWPRWAFVLWFGVANLGLHTALTTPASVTLALRIAEIDPEGKVTSLATVLAIGSFVGFAANPLFGRLSDRTTGRWGMRKPWLVAGLAVATVTTVVMASATSLVLITLSWSITKLALNAAGAPLAAVVPDQFPDRQRARISGFIGALQQASPAVGAFFVQGVGESSFWMFMVPALVAFAAVILFALILPDRRLDRAEVDPLTFREIIGSYWFDVRAHPNFAWVWLCRFLIWMAIASATSYQPYFLSDRLGMTDGELAEAVFETMLVLSGGLIVFGNVFGFISDRVGKRRIFVLASGFGIVSGLLVIAFSQDYAQFLIGATVIGVSGGVFIPTDVALAIETMPDERREAGHGMGMLNLSTAVPNSLAPAVAPLALGIGSAGYQNYTALFVASAITAAAGVALIFLVRNVK